MRIAVAQLNTCAGDFAQTVERMVAYAQRAADDGADLLVFPLATLTGTLPVEYASQQGYGMDLEYALQALAERVACPCLVPFVFGSLESFFPHAVIVRDATVTLASRSDVKTSPTPQASIFSFDGMRLALAFTYEDVENFIDTEESVDAVLYVSCYGYALDDAGSAMGAALLENRFRMDARTLDTWLVGVGSLGGYGQQVYAGASFVLNPAGELIASASAFEEAMICADVSGRGQGSETASEAAQPIEPEIFNRSLHLWESLTLGLHDYVSKCGQSDVCLALDGRLASCLLAVLATDAMGPTHVHILQAACDPTSRQAASDLMRALRVHVADEGWLAAMGECDEQDYADLVQARLSQIARATGALPLSAQDKTYLALEATPDACRAAALLPFGDVYRSDLLELAHLRNTISPMLPATCFQAYDVPVIEGLDEVERTPETRLRRVDVTLATYVEWERALTDTIARQGEQAVTQGILHALHRIETARVIWPPYLMVSSRTLSDVRYPLGMAWQDSVRTQDERSEAKAWWHSLFESEKKEARSSLSISQLPGLSELFGGVETELMAAGPLPEGVDQQTIERSVNDLLGLIHDIMQSDASMGNDQMPEGPFGPLTWGSPFSEN